MLGTLFKTITGRRRAEAATTASGLAAVGATRAGDGRAFESALRHSRRVRFLRKAIPAFCVAAVAGPVAWGVISPFARVGLDVQVGPVSMAGTKVTMESPRLSGFKKDGKAYEVSAVQAVQDIKTPTIVELNKLTSRMEQDAKKFARLSADWGRFDQSADNLDLKGNVRVRTDGGYEADLFSAKINVKTGDVVSTEPVVVRSVNATVTADRAEVRENGRHAIFEGRVRSTFTQVDAPASAETPAKISTQ